MGSAMQDDMIQAIMGTRESNEIAATRPDLVEQGGAPHWSARLRLVHEHARRVEALSDQHLRAGRAGLVLSQRSLRQQRPSASSTRGADGKEALFNPPGVDMGDVAGMAGGVPDLVGAIMGGAASVPAYAAGPAGRHSGRRPSPAPAARSSSARAVGRLFPENRADEPEIMKDVLPRAGGEMAQRRA